MDKLRLNWYKRELDGLWNAECSCKSTLAGFGQYEREHAESEHFDCYHYRNLINCLKPGTRVTTSYGTGFMVEVRDPKVGKGKGAYLMVLLDGKTEPFSIFWNELSGFYND